METRTSAAAALEETEASVDTVVLKRLRFVLKIIKALALQPNTRSRQCQLYIYEVVDAIKDWSGKPQGGIRSFIDNQIFPSVCRLISTCSKAEFNEFQQFYGKFIFSKWEETCNFNVLDFLADIYGFITRIAPPSVGVELVEIFKQEEIPIHVSLIMLPSIIKNLPEEVANNNNLTDKASRHFLRLQNDRLPPQYLNLLIAIWKGVRKLDSQTENMYQLTPILHRCIATSVYLEYLQEDDVLKILEVLADWSESVTVNSEGFLLITTLFLNSIRTNPAMLEKDPRSDILVRVNRLMKGMVVIAEGCRNKHIRVFTMKVLQRILEYSTESNDEVLSELLQRNLQCEENEFGSDQNANNALLDALEVSVKQISSEVKVNEPERKRIRLMIDSLQNLLDK